MRKAAKAWIPRREGPMAGRAHKATNRETPMEMSSIQLHKQIIANYDNLHQFEVMSSYISIQHQT